MPLLMPPASLNGTPLCRLDNTCFTIESTQDLLARLLVPIQCSIINYCISYFTGVEIAF